MTDQARTIESNAGELNCYPEFSTAHGMTLLAVTHSPLAVGAYTEIPGYFSAQIRLPISNIASLPFDYFAGNENNQ
jgi:hypothetical protein